MAMQIKLIVVVVEALLIWPETQIPTIAHDSLVRYRQLPCAHIEFEPALESRREISLVWHTLFDSR